MRMEAAQVGVHSEDGYSGDASYSLTNPLVEASATPSVHAGPNVARRFDYYTDPMSAFSATRAGARSAIKFHQTLSRLQVIAYSLT